MIIECLSFQGCPGIEPALAALRKVLADEGVADPIEGVEIADVETARALRFLGSPSIHIDGQDIEVDRREDEPCYGCRLYPGGGSCPPESMIRDAVRAARKGKADA
jgi:hypothetical protein